jgi:hypothetical protein
MNQTGILKRAASITWHQRGLWAVGLVGAAFLYTVPALLSSNVESLGHQLAEVSWPQIAGLGLDALAAELLGGAVAMVGYCLYQGALIAMVGDIERTGRASIGSALLTSWARLPRILGISLLMGLLLAVAVGLALGGAFLPAALDREAGLAAVVCFLPIGFALGLVLGIAAAASVELMLRRCVLQDKGVIASFRQGWRLLGRNRRRVLMVWLPLIAVGVVAVAATAACIMVREFAPSFLASLLGRSPATAPAARVAGLAVATMAWVAHVSLYGLYMTFYSATWTLAYWQLAGMPKPRRRRRRASPARAR